MVCRENKARSAIMGYEKHMLRQMGYTDYKDFEFQSTIHEYGHSYSAAPDPTPEEYLAFLHGARQQVINDPSLSEADKFRVSNKQPGIVTRLDQEIERVRTGRDEHGRLLKPDQINGGKHFAAMKRLGVPMVRQQSAKDAYLETYARTTGTTLQEAHRRWDDLVSRPMEERKNTQISLTDDWRDRLTVAGITGQQQADIGQSNVAREALRLMESERQAKIRTLPSRPTISPDNRQRFYKPGDPQVQIRCEGCGQFGHEQSACPNAAEVEAVARAADAYEARVMEAMRHRHAAQAAADLERLEKGEQVGADLNGDGQLWVVDPREAPTHTNADGTTVVSLNAVPADSPEAAALLREVADSGDPSKARDAALDAKEAGVHFEMAQDALEDKRGPIPMVSAAVQEIGYDPDSGLLEVTAHPYTRKRTGEKMPAKTYAYRLSPSEYEEMMASGKPGHYASTHFFGRRENSKYRYENEAEEHEARVQRRCPSCNQFASMTSAHQCPIDGSMNSKEEAAYRERLRQAREQARVNKLPVSLADTTPRHRVEAVSTAALADGGNLRFPERNRMLMARDKGQVGMGGFTAQYLGQRVTGRIYTWKDPSTGEMLARADNVSCTCGGSSCRHVSKAVDLMTATYGAKAAPGVTPGGRRFAEPAQASSDAPDRDFTRTPYEKIRDQRREAAATQNRVFADYPDRRTVVSRPIDASTGQPTQAPTQWSSGGSTVRLDQPGETAAALGQNLSRATGQSWAVRTNADGSIRITAPSSRARGGRMSDADQRSLARALGLRGRAGSTGVHVPADPSWRSEFLDRSAGQEPRVLGSRFVVDRPHRAAGPQA